VVWCESAHYIALEFTFSVEVNHGNSRLSESTLQPEKN
jgi:hypothetical protein